MGTLNEKTGDTIDVVAPADVNPQVSLPGTIVFCWHQLTTSQRESFDEKISVDEVAK